MVLVARADGTVRTQSQAFHYESTPASSPLHVLLLATRIAAAAWNSNGRPLTNVQMSLSAGVSSMEVTGDA